MRINDLLLPKYANVNVDDGAVPSPLFPSPQFAQAARDLAANGPRSPWPPGFQPPTSAAAQIAMAAAAAAQAHAQATSGSGEGITSPLSPWGFPSGQHSPVHLVHMAAANAANASATAGGSASPEQARQQQPIKAPTVRLGPVPAAVHPMSAHVQQAGQLTASSSSSSQPQPTRSSTTSSAPGSGAGQAQEQGEQAQGGDQDQEVVPAAMALTVEQGALQAPSQPNAAPAPAGAAATGATSASSSILAALALKRKQLDRPYPPHYMPTPRSTPPVNQQQGGQGQPDSREHRDRTDMSQHPASNLYQAYPPPPPVPLITPSGLPLGWHPSQPYPPLAAMPFQAQQHLATIGGTPATSGATTPNMDDTGSSSGRQRAGSAPPPGGRRGSARPGGAPMLDLPQPRTEGSPAPHPQQQGQQRSGSGSTSASPGPFMPANGNGQYQQQQQQQQQRSGQHHHGRTSYSAVGPHASAYDPSVGGAVGAAGVSSHSAAAALQPLVDPNQPGIHTAIVMHPPPHMQHAMLPPPGGPQQHHHQHMHQQQHHPHPAPPQAARASRIPIMDDDVVVLHTTDNMQRPFACIHCGRAFWRRYDCKRHMRVHTDERPYACRGCDRTFARKDALNRHLQAAGCSAGIAAQAAQLRGQGVDPVQAAAAVAAANAAASAARNGVTGGPQYPQEYQQLNQQSHHNQQQHQDEDMDQQQQQDSESSHSPQLTPPQPEVSPATTVSDLPTPIHGSWRATTRPSRPSARSRSSRPLHLNIQPHAVQQQQMAMLAAAAAAAAQHSPVTLSHPASAASMHSPLVQPSPIAQQFQQVEMTAAAVIAAGGVLSPVVASGLMSPTMVVPSTPTVASMPDTVFEQQQHQAQMSPPAAVASSSSGGSPGMATNGSM